MQYQALDLSGSLLDGAASKACGRKHLPRDKYSPSTNWAEGGPLVESGRIEVGPNYKDGDSNLEGPDHEWHAVYQSTKYCKARVAQSIFASGPTPLVAAMRCYVVLKLGSTIELP